MDTALELSSITSTLDQLGTSSSCSEIGNKLNLIWKQFQEQGKDDEAAMIDYERQACLLTVRSTIVLSYGGDDTKNAERFSGMVGFSDGSEWPDPDQFSPEAFAYLQSRATGTPNPVLKARYHDLIFEKSKLQEKHKSALAAIDAYLESAEGFSASKHVSHQLEMIADMDQAATLALKLGNLEKLSLVISALLNLIERQAAPVQSPAFGNRPRGRWALELSRILLYIRRSPRYGKYVLDANVEHIKNIAADLAELNAEDRFARREFLSIASLAANLLHQSEDEYSLELQAGEALVYQGEASQQQAGNGPRHLIAASFYENAVQHYQRMRERMPISPEQRTDLLARENRLKHEIREMYRLGRNEFGRFEVPIEVPQDELDSLLDDLLAPASLDACLHRIVTEGSLLPNLESAAEATEDIALQAPLLSLFPKRKIRDDITVSIAENETQRVSQRTHDNLLLWIQVNSSIVLTNLFSRMQEQKGMNAESLVDYFSATGLFDEDNLALIQTGLARYFADDYISALHILVPQFEDVLRTLFERGGKGVIQPRNGQTGWEVETFGKFLAQDIVKTTLLPEMMAYIQLVMTEQTGWNLRNRIAHGLIRPQDCNIVTAVTVVHLYLLLTLLHLEERDER